MAQVFYNNRAGNLSGSHAADATALTLQAGHNFPDPGTDYYLATLILIDSSARESAWEIVRVTDVAGNVLTVGRAQEGTTALVWASGTRLEVRLTAGAVESKANLGPAAYKDVGTGATHVAAGDHNHSSLYQPLDSDLTALAGLSTTGLIERTGAGTASITTVTAAGKALLDDADAATQRTTLGLGTAATMAGPSGTLVGTTDTQTLSAKTITALKETKTASSAYNFDLSAGNYFTHAASANNLTVSNVPATGTVASLIIELTNGGAYTFSFWSGVKWAGGAVPALTAAGVDILGFYTHDGGTTWRGLLLAKDSK